MMVVLSTSNFLNSVLSKLYQVHTQQHPAYRLRRTATNLLFAYRGKNTSMGLALACIARQYIKFDLFGIVDMNLTDGANI